MTEKQLAQEIERDKMLYNAECRALRNKINSKTSKGQQEYGAVANTIHRDRTMKLSLIDDDTNTGICICGRPVDICDEPVYCRYCGQRTSGVFGWTVHDYYNEKGLGIR